jgi:hypothetical protein
MRLNSIDTEEGAIADRELASRITRLADAYHSRGRTYQKRADLDHAARDLETARRPGYDGYQPRNRALSGPGQAQPFC